MSVILTLAYTPFLSGTNIYDILQQWETFGIFEYVLPALLVFATVFGILTKSKILGEDSRGVNMVIAIAVALLAIQSYDLRAFFRTIFPLAGVGLSLLLVALILTGLFHSDKDWWGYVFFGLGMFIAIIVGLSSLSTYQWSGGWWWQDNWSAIITLLILVGLILLVVLGTKSKK